MNIRNKINNLQLIMPVDSCQLPVARWRSNKEGKSGVNDIKSKRRAFGGSDALSLSIIMAKRRWAERSQNPTSSYWL